MSKHAVARAKKRTLKQLLRHNEGAAAMEFAFVSTVLFILMFGTIEVGMVMYASNVLESAMSNSARLGKTGYTASGISREQTILNSIATRTAGLIDMNLLTITTKVYPTFATIGDEEPYQDTNSNGVRDSGETYQDINGNGQWDADMGTAGLGNASDIVLYTVSYPWHISTPLISNLFGNNSTYTISARAVVRNEPYNVQ
jgi:Flp pilus assembly protein TadG